ncbi:Mannan endo-1,4-beta-mannosidase 1 [Acorus gramineus]|uniref:Mannan endo-1,4-beta-mannosidase 1 n=1 Tax=Acorus gramineus TaxID=55184 RepID=A0AAV9BTR6_ACOGR|nr:Mannan endo-1,4-beta-mannosidase 1 [Acorus gramineus]
MNSMHSKKKECCHLSQLRTLMRRMQLLNEQYCHLSPTLLTFLTPLDLYLTPPSPPPPLPSLAKASPPSPPPQNHHFLLMYERQACIGVLVCLALQILFKHGVAVVDGNQDFVKVRNTHFEVHGRPFYSNGFNAYWLMNLAADPSQRYLVTRAFQVATNPGMAVVRTWAFSEFGNDHLLRSPGNYNENIFKRVWIS